LKLRCDKLLSNFACFAFNSNMYPYTEDLIFGSNSELRAVAEVGRCRLTPGFHG